MEAESLHVQKLGLVHPVADGRRAVKSLAQLPRMASRTQPLLPLACRKVYSHRHGIVIAVGKTLRDRFAEPADAYHHLGLIVDTPHEIGDEEGFVTLQERRGGLGENHRRLWLI